MKKAMSIALVALTISASAAPSFAKEERHAGGGKVGGSHAHGLASVGKFGGKGFGGKGFGGQGAVAGVFGLALGIMAAQALQ